MDTEVWTQVIVGWGWQRCPFSSGSGPGAWRGGRRAREGTASAPRRETVR